MIDWFFGPRTSDGVKHDTLLAAQAREMMLLINGDTTTEATCLALAEQGPEVIAILQTKPGQPPRRRVRKDKGKPRKPTETKP